jgi:hypothetical protein
MSRKLYADLVAETTTTAGTGTVTLTALAGFARFSDRFSNGDLVFYSIRDGNNWEVGKGTYTTANQLARTTILGSYVSGVADWATATAITLSGSAATVRAVAPETLFQSFIREEVAFISGNTAAVDGYAYGVQANSVTITLPASPVVGDRIRVFQAAASITGCVINPNGADINDTAGNMTVDTTEFSFSLLYVSASYGWKVLA